MLTLNIALGTVYIVPGSKEMKRGSVWGSQPSILGGPCAWDKLGPCARGSRGHGTGPCARGAPAPTSVQPMGTRSPGTSSFAGVALRLGPRGLRVVPLLLGGAPEPVGGVPLRT